MSSAPKLTWPMGYPTAVDGLAQIVGTKPGVDRTARLSVRWRQASRWPRSTVTMALWPSEPLSFTFATLWEGGKVGV